MKKKFLLISQMFYPDEVSTAGLFTNLCEVIAKKGVKVEVWCAQPSYNTRKKQPRKIQYNGISIRYLFSSNANKDWLAGRLLNYTAFSFLLIIRILASSSKLPVFSSTNPPLLGIIIAFLCTIKKRKFNYIVQYIFPDGLVGLGKIKKNSLANKIWSKLNRITLKKANKVIIIGRDMIEWIESVYPLAKEKTLYIPIWQDAKLIHPIAKENNNFIKNNNLDGKFIIQYSGNMGLWNDMELVGHAINTCEQIEDIHFMFIGGGIRKAELINSLNDEAKQKSSFHPFQPKTNINQSLTACDIALVSLKAGLEGMAVPSKIMGILAAGVPVIALVPEESEIAYIINHEKCGFVVSSELIEEFAQKVDLLKNNSSLYTEMALNSRKVFEEKYCTETIAKQYLNLL